MFPTCKHLFPEALAPSVKGAALTTEDQPPKIKEYFQYAHQLTRGDTLTVPDFSAEVAKWWGTVQPEWRCSKQEPPQSPNQWSYILSGGSKGAFLVILCLVWWDCAYEWHLEKQKEVRRVAAEAAGIVVSFDDLLNHNAVWLNVVNDVAFIMRQAQDCDVPTWGMLSPSHGERGSVRKIQYPLNRHQQSNVVRGRRPRFERFHGPPFYFVYNFLGVSCASFAYEHSPSMFLLTTCFTAPLDVRVSVLPTLLDSFGL